MAPTEKNYHATGLRSIAATDAAPRPQPRAPSPPLPAPLPSIPPRAPSASREMYGWAPRNGRYCSSGAAIRPRKNSRQPPAQRTFLTGAFPTRLRALGVRRQAGRFAYRRVVVRAQAQKENANSEKNEKRTKKRVTFCRDSATVLPPFCHHSATPAQSAPSVETAEWWRNRRRPQRRRWRWCGVESRQNSGRIQAGKFLARFFSSPHSAVFLAAFNRACASKCRHAEHLPALELRSVHG